MYYIIKTKEGEYVKVSPIFLGNAKPREFAEFGSNTRRWKYNEVEIVELPTKYGRERTYKYLDTILPPHLQQSSINGITIKTLLELPEVKEKIEEINKITIERDYWKKRCEQLSKNIIKEDS